MSSMQLFSPRVPCFVGTSAAGRSTCRPVVIQRGKLRCQASKEGASLKRLEKEWREVDKELISIGKNGVGAGHRNMLQELCQHHPQGVKVKIGHTSVDVDEATAELLKGTGVELQQVKGRTLMFKAK